MGRPDDTAVLLNISDMIDLAIGTPEVGVVDFNMLQTVLHCLAQQLRVLGKNVELRGSMANIATNKENVQTVAVSEYMVDTEDSSVPEKRQELTVSAPPVSPEAAKTMLVVERIKKMDSTKIEHSVMSEVSSAKGRKPSQATEVGTTGTKVRSGAPDKLSLVTLSKFNLLENIVEDLKNRVYGSIPKNEDILDEVRSQSNLKAITDMWTSLNVSTRLEAAETGLSKLSSLIQDLIREAEALKNMPEAAALSVAAVTAQRGTSAVSSSSYPNGAPTTISETRKPSVMVASDLSTDPGQLATETGPPVSTQIQPISGTEVGDGMSKDYLQKIRSDLDDLTRVFYRTIEQLQAETNLPLPNLPPISEPIMNEFEESPASITDATSALSHLGEQDRRNSLINLNAITSQLVERVGELEKELEKCCESIAKNNGAMQDQVNSLQDQLEDIMKHLANVDSDLSTGCLSSDLMKDIQGLVQLFQTVQEMQGQLKEVHETALQLAAEKEDRQYHLDALLEQIELLKTIKMDKEDVEEAIAEKADMKQLARKVSRDQFEMACDDLSKGLEHALGKLGMQETLWQQALDDIQREIEVKLDKVELSPVKEFFNNKLKQLQESLKQMASLRREVEAAGTKRRLLRDVNCLSCDAQAVMAMEAGPSLPGSKPLPVTLSMKPYLSYELDAIRKIQASNVQQRNMRDWEHIDKQMTHQQPKQPPKAKSESSKHLCNRYCGGSHTVTTPAQRVARLGHFIKQWGPEVLPLSSGLAAGDDGKMYKVSTTEDVIVGPGGSADVTCTPRKEMKSDARISSPKPLVISAECRCLEGGTS